MAHLQPGFNRGRGKTQKVKGALGHYSHQTKMGPFTKARAISSCVKHNAKEEYPRGADLDRRQGMTRTSYLNAP